MYLCIYIHIYLNSVSIVVLTEFLVTCLLHWTHCQQFSKTVYSRKCAFGFHIITWPCCMAGYHKWKVIKYVFCVIWVNWLLTLKAYSFSVEMMSLKRILEVKVWPWYTMGSPSLPSQQSTSTQRQPLFRALHTETNVTNHHCFVSVKNVCQI